MFPWSLGKASALDSFSIGQLLSEMHRPRTGQRGSRATEARKALEIAQMEQDQEVR